ncbi:zinc metalloprotease HtpX [Stappia sp.]|jgi:heat shock protein HtpX|uniref:zinc metalloprotease HtpX n=1 Tax=Stappia sp. TaxID=1870903 RepID=UPI003A9A0A0D
MTPLTIDPAVRTRFRRRNRAQTLALGVGAVLLLCLCAFAIAGGDGVLWALIGGSFAVWLATRVSPQIVLGLYGARELAPAEDARAHMIVRLLSERAGLSAVPRLFQVPSRLMNAFSSGRPDDAVICVTDGLLTRMSSRELVAVLAHEIAHVAHGDILVMALADVVSRMTTVMSMLGLFLAFFNLPSLIEGREGAPFAIIAALLVAPALGTLLQLALSRTREFDADLGAAELTGDPEGLALALTRLDRMQGRMWEAVLPTGARTPDPSVLRTHPRTEERIERLMALKASPDRWIDDKGHPHVRARSPIPDAGRPRHRLRGLGLWH